MRGLRPCLLPSTRYAFSGFPPEVSLKTFGTGVGLGVGVGVGAGVGSALASAAFPSCLRARVCIGEVGGAWWKRARKGSVICVRANVCVNTVGEPTTHPAFSTPSHSKRGVAPLRVARPYTPRAAGRADPTPSLSYRGDLDLDLGCLDEGEDESEDNQGDQCAHVGVSECRCLC